MSHSDIRIGTMVRGSKGAGSYVRQILPHGFESVQVMFWQNIPADVDLDRLGKEVREAAGDRAVVSAIAMFGNVLTNESSARDFARSIDAAREAFGCDVVLGFAGACEGAALPESLPAFRKVWPDLVKRAADKGVRVAFENCEMGGTWQAPKWNIAHAPQAWEMIFNELKDAPNVGLCWEPCHQLVSLADPIAQLRKWAPKVVTVHGKDATVAWDVIREHGIRGGKPYVWHRHPGFGDTNWTDVISILRQNKYRGVIDIEGWHDPVYRDELEMTGQVHALNYLKRCRGGPFVPNPT